MNGVLATLAAQGGWLALVAIALAAIALAWLAQLQKRLRLVTPDTRRLVRDMEGKSIDEVLRDLLGNMEFLAGRLGRLEVASEGLARQFNRTIQHVGLVKYNAEEDLGGELSFALVLLDAGRHGLILTSVHTLHDCRLYLRTVRHGRCEHDMSEEEGEALEMALGRVREPSGGPRLRRTRWREKERGAKPDIAATEQKGVENAE
jgi:hypothetical protein